MSDLKEALRSAFLTFNTKHFLKEYQYLKNNNLLKH